ncbi:DNA-(apurinic or apyrimidinic site) lyase [Methanohalobium evestigatum Z-7303]|uniref:8-oxoguanine DNA glycosylase/AP lyase n=1 Tax=Methanohalobium evestigatum (strain ATCC BAA-1072 / DSM 3721 / NBRC 107634 / OCM 161 / Z-7303) TaxID=644295 RepID=D7EBS0_METEZ|nr:N-glycosylase/DNA lyase [Methanohalobium evestigatum]ADI74912.1 DNA-(apurinic or apyrimidinic site) lyase [Methanohalobium evestigatum Z-7303]
MKLNIESRKDLIRIVEDLKADDISEIVDKRIREFESLYKKGNKEWFNELCFCLLTANSSARLGIDIQDYMKENDGFLTYDQKELSTVLKQMGHRFYEKRAEYIILARDNAADIRDKITSMENEFTAREWIVKKIKGIGYKESSHFLRNVGYKHLAILDKHILRILSNSGLIEVPKTLTRKKYYNIEQVFSSLAEEASLTPAELDLYLWYTQTGEVLK